MTTAELQTAAVAYVNRGWALTWLGYGEKFPTHREWNTPGKVVITADAARQVWNGTRRNLGVVHSLGAVKTCSFDVDQVEHTRAVLAEFGIDLEALRVGVPCVVGNPAHFRLLYRQPDGADLPLVKLEWPDSSDQKKKVTLFELRAGANQDVLPPSLHPNGRRYEWATALPEDPADHPAPPPALLELWLNWTAWEPALRAACPWAEPKAPPHRKAAGANLDVIGQFNAAHDVRNLLEAHGYQPRGTKRFLPPNSTSGVPSVRLLDSGKVFSSNGSCPLNDGHAHDAFSVFCILEHRGDVRVAVKNAAERLGIECPESDRNLSKQGETSYSEGNRGNKVKVLNDKEKSCYPDENDRVTEVTPYYFMLQTNGTKVGGRAGQEEIEEKIDKNTPRPAGLWYVGTGQVPTPDGKTVLRYFSPVWVSIPFEILATADDGRGHGYCVAIRFRALHGQLHVWPIPRALLVTDGREILNRLYAMGFKALDKPSKANDHIRAYLNRATPARQALSVSKTGWAGGRFVLPDRVFGEDAASVFYQTDDPRPSPYTTAGSLAGWREGVARAVEPYDLPVFSICAAFAAPLLDLMGIPSGGFHYMGTTTTGKTTSQNWALSVWGKPKELRHTWHGTKVGFELTAAAHADGVLMLDEIGQADPREVGELVYMVFNEAGRMRGTARLSHRSLPRWQLLLLSSGEKSLQQMMQDAGKVPMAGQELRLLHIPVDGGDGCGVLNDLTDRAARTDLIRAVDNAVAENHGFPIQEFLTRLTRPETLAQTPAATAQVKKLTNTLTDGIASDEVKRAALRFALVGFAGELAAEWGITGWPSGRAARAATAIFKRWAAGWGTAARHDETVFLEHMEVWLSGNCAGHFAEVDAVTLDLTPTAERALTGMRPFYGYTADAATGRVFYLNAAGWSALTKSFARSLVIETLTAAKRLEKDPRGNKGKVIRVGGSLRTLGRYYIIREAVND
jgi:uncharacterized protein (DUF927 family)